MDIKLVAVDMDGTLLDSKKRMPADFITWVKEHESITTVIASGRQYFTLEKDFSDIKDKLVFIAENGGLVVKNNKIIYSNIMEKEDIEICLEIILKNEIITPVLCGEKSAYMLQSNKETFEHVAMYYERLKAVDNLYECIDKDNIIKLALYINNYKAEESMRLFDNLGERIKPVLSGDSWIDIANSTVNKGEAIKAILKKFEIDRKNAMAFGDYLNDYELIRACEESYCMENGHEALKKIAKYVTASNDEDGVMKVLRKL